MAKVALASQRTCPCWPGHPRTPATRDLGPEQATCGGAPRVPVCAHFRQQKRQAAQARVPELPWASPPDWPAERSGAGRLPMRHAPGLDEPSAGLAAATACGLPAPASRSAEPLIGSTGSSCVDRFSSMASCPPTSKTPQRANDHGFFSAAPETLTGRPGPRRSVGRMGDRCRGLNSRVVGAMSRVTSYLDCDRWMQAEARAAGSR